MKNKIIKSLLLVFPLAFLSGCTPSVDPAPKPTPPDPTYKSFDVGTGVKDWGTKVIAPFVDYTNYWGYNEPYGNKGAAKMTELASKIGTNKFNLGFIQSVSATTQEPNPTKDGKIRWGWGQLAALSEEEKLNEQYSGMKEEISRIRNVGGDVSISVGGLTGAAFWILPGVTEDMLYDVYMTIVIGYGLTYFDLDIEGSGMNKEKNVVNARAIKRMQEKTNVKINLTLPINWDGLDHNGLAVLDAYLEQDVRINDINLMTMCYTNYPVEKDFGDLTIMAVDTASTQIVNKWKQFGKTVSQEQAYKMIGEIPSIGFETSLFPIYDTVMHKKVVDHAKLKNLAVASMWCLDRDAKAGSYKDNPGVTNQFEFSNITKTFKN